jgi:hypothetical protein
MTNGAAVTEPTMNASIAVPIGVGEDPWSGMKPSNAPEVRGCEADDDWEVAAEDVVPFLFIVTTGLEEFAELVDEGPVVC